MEVRWSMPAAEDLERSICEWIERDNPDAPSGQDDKRLGL